MIIFLSHLIQHEFDIYVFPVCLCQQLFERILEIPITWLKGRATGEVLF